MLRNHMTCFSREKKARGSKRVQALDPSLFLDLTNFFKERNKERFGKDRDETQHVIFGSETISASRLSFLREGSSVDRSLSHRGISRGKQGSSAPPMEKNLIDGRRHLGESRTTCAWDLPAAVSLRGARADKGRLFPHEEKKKRERSGAQVKTRAMVRKAGFGGFLGDVAGDSSGDEEEPEQASRKPRSPPPTAPAPAPAPAHTPPAPAPPASKHKADKADKAEARQRAANNNSSGRSNNHSSSKNSSNGNSAGRNGAVASSQASLHERVKALKQQQQAAAVQPPPPSPQSNVATVASGGGAGTVVGSVINGPPPLGFLTPPPARRPVSGGGQATPRAALAPPPPPPVSVSSAPLQPLVFAQAPATELKRRPVAAGPAPGKSDAATTARPVPAAAGAGAGAGAGAAQAMQLAKTWQPGPTGCVRLQDVHGTRVVAEYVLHTFTGDALWGPVHSLYHTGEPLAIGALPRFHHPLLASLNSYTTFAVRLSWFPAGPPVGRVAPGTPQPMGSTELVVQCCPQFYDPHDLGRPVYKCRITAPRGDSVLSSSGGGAGGGGAGAIVQELSDTHSNVLEAASGVYFAARAFEVGPGSDTADQLFRLGREVPDRAKFRYLDFRVGLRAPAPAPPPAAHSIFAPAPALSLSRTDEAARPPFRLAWTAHVTQISLNLSERRTLY